MTAAPPTLALVVAAALVAGCGGGGDKPSGALPRAPETMRLASTALVDGATIPKRFTCSDEGVSNRERSAGILTVGLRPGHGEFDESRSQ